MRINAKKRADAAAVAERRIQVFDLRKQGADFRTIGTRIGISYETARRDLSDYLALQRQDRRTAIEEERQLEAARLDMLLLRYLPLALAAQRREPVTDVLGRGIVDPDGEPVFRAVNPDPQYANLIIRLMERRAKLLGLDAPTEISGPNGGPIKFEIQDSREILKAKILGMMERLHGPDGGSTVISGVSRVIEQGRGDGVPPEPPGIGSGAPPP